MKRLSNVDHETKKFRVLIEENKSMTCIENLSNELFYEIFDYLDGCDIFDAFSNLNNRFQELLNSSLYLFKIYRFSTKERTFKRYCKQIILSNKHKIISINLYDQTLINLFCTLCNIDLSFNRLESLVLNGIKINQLLPLLMDLMDLPRLFSLNICLIGDYEDLDHVYQLIFYLPFLKYIKLSTAINERTELLPISMPDQISTIEHLNINHRCTLHELNVILSCASNLRCLTCQRLFDSDSVFSTTLSNLTHISVNNCYFNFDEFEIFIKQISSKLRVIRFINRSNDTAYLDANRWERLILRYIPVLCKFDLKFFENLSTSHSFTLYHTRMNQFTTSFWIERQWIFAIEINHRQIIYSIHSYRKRWCEFYDLKHVIINNSSIQFCQSIQLSVTECCDKDDQIIFDKIKHISSWVRITRLKIDCSRVSMITFIELIRLLPNSDSLRVVPMSGREIHSLTETKIERLNNNITKINIGLITEIVQVMIFLDLFPHMKYLEVNCANDIDLEILVQSILTKIANCITPQLCSLCLCVGQINDEILEKLHQIMAFQNCLHDYIIKRVCDRIYLQWK